MKRLLFVFCVSGVASAFAAPSVSDVQASPKAGGTAVRVAYTLGNEPAVVTLGLYEKATGAYIAEAAYTNLSGDVNCLVQPGRRFITWTKAAGWSRTDADIDVRLRAWPTNCPPDYLVLDLTDKAKAKPARYYVSTNAFPVPLADVMYRTSHLVMRKIPAANVEWRMGSPEQEAERAKGYTRAGTTEYSAGENLHYVRLTEDYYLGIYPVTYRQHANGSGQGLSYGAWGQTAFASVRRDDWPYAPTQFVSLRSWMHDNDKGCDGNCAAHILAWPEDGHAIDAAKSLKCEKSTGTYTPYLRDWRNNYGFEFDIPTDAQWEFACRAGTLGMTYNDNRAAYTNLVPQAKLDDIAWNVNNSYNSAAECHTAQVVGQKQPNAFGLYDMLGNVFEWCLDVKHAPAISADTTVDPVGATGVANNRNRQCILRGGSFCSPVGLCRSAARVKCIVPGLNNNCYSMDGLGNEATSSWHCGYRLCLPAQAAR